MKKLTASQIMLKKPSWSALFDNEQELIDTMLEVKIEKGLLVPKGYEYIQSFQNYYQRERTLTKSQITQLKRLAKNIYVYTNGLNVSECLVRL